MDPSVEYACWFCNQGLDRREPHALAIGLTNLWEADFEAGPTQMIYAHYVCAAERMNGAAGFLEPDVFFDDTN